MTELRVKAWSSKGSKAAPESRRDLWDDVSIITATYYVCEVFGEQRITPRNGHMVVWESW